MKVSPEARHRAKYKEKKKKISVATLQFDVTFFTPILCAPSIYSGDMTIGSEWNESTQRAYVYIYSGNTVKGSDCNEVKCEMLWLYVLVILSKDLTGLR